MKRVAAFVGLLLLGLLVAAAGGWGVLALAISGPQAETLRLALAAGFGAAAVAALVSLALKHWRWRGLGLFVALFAGVLVWFFSLEPRNDREWVAENALLPWEKSLVAGTMATHPGVYCLRSSETAWDEERLWRTYTMLTDLESVSAV